LRIGGEIGGQYSVRDVLDQSQSVGRGRYAERHIAPAGLPCKILLYGVALRSIAARIDAAAYHEQRMHAAIPLPVRQQLEARLADRPVGGDERRQSVFGTHLQCHCGLRINGWSTAAVNRE